MSSGSVTHWIDLFRGGDDEAANQLWSRYFSRLVGVARAKIGQMPGGLQDAEDVALSAFHAFYRAASAQRLPDMTDRDGLWQTLLVITAGKVIDAKRRDLSQKRGGGLIVHTDLQLADSILGGEPDPTLAAMLTEEFENLLNVLDDRELQEIAILKMEGYTNDEIAQRLDCGERTVKRRLAVIRRVWEESGVAPPG